MPSFAVKVPHSLPQEEVVQRLSGLLEKVKQRYQNQVSNLAETWSGNKLAFGFTTYGFDIKGNLAVAADQVSIDGQLPFAALLFKGRIEQTIRDELVKLLA